LAPLRIGATVAGSVGSVELATALSSLALLLGQRIVQIALNFNTLLALRLSRCLALSRVSGNRRQRNILLWVLFAAAVWSWPAAGMLAVD
jgi:hypothetical protein